MNIEELIKQAEAAWEGCDGCDDDDKNMWVGGYVKGVLANHIELPSDEDIEKKFIPRTDMYGLYGTGFKDGAKWVVEKIKQQDND